MPLIDTLALKTGLLDGGMPEAQAAAIVAALANADVGQLAAKADVERLREDMRLEIGDVRMEVEGLRDDMGRLSGKVTLLLVFNVLLTLAVCAVLFGPMLFAL